MRPDAPSPGKRSFGYPLPAESLEHFVHPGGIPAFEAAGLDGEVAVVANGFLALRIETYLDLPPASPALLERVAALPWDRFERLEDPKRWKPMTDCLGKLFRGFRAGDNGVRPIWERSRNLYHLRKAPAVRIGKAGVTSLGLAQLCSRLPRAELWTDTRPGEPVFLRFNGGRGILAHWDHFAAPKLTILAPRRDPIDGTPVF